MLVDRENEIFNFLDRLAGSGIDFIVVGGYAVSALSRHRFSVDCDIVIHKENFDKIKNVLVGEGFKENTRKTGFDKTYGGEFANFIKKINKLPVTIDLLINGLTSRSTEAAWGFDYILKNSITAKIVGSQRSVSCKTPEKELLLAMKIHSARRTDIRDIIMLLENSDLLKVFEHIRRGNIESLKKNIGVIENALSDSKLPDSIKGVFSLQKRVDKEIEQTKNLIPKLSQRL